MKRCPACNRTYANDAQKFCTQDGIALVDAHSAGAGQGETVRIDSAQLDDEVTKVISKELPRTATSGTNTGRDADSKCRKDEAGDSGSRSAAIFATRGCGAVCELERESHRQARRTLRRFFFLLSEQVAEGSEGGCGRRHELRAR